MNMKNDLIMEELYAETEKRLEQMQQNDYEFPEKIANIDIAVIITMVVISGILITLCMTGVIR